jgi:cytochrome d ubiquinol oxidase subunit I
MTPFLTANAAATTLILFAAVYSLIFSFGIYFIYRLLHAGPAGSLGAVPANAAPNRPMPLAESKAASNRDFVQAGE